MSNDLTERITKAITLYNEWLSECNCLMNYDDFVVIKQTLTDCKTALSACPSFAKATEDKPLDDGEMEQKYKHAMENLDYMPEYYSATITIKQILTALHSRIATLEGVLTKIHPSIERCTEIAYEYDDSLCDNDTQTEFCELMLDVRYDLRTALNINVEEENKKEPPHERE